MYQIREVFQAKPGKAKDLGKMYKLTAPHLKKTGGAITYQSTYRYC